MEESGIIVQKGDASEPPPAKKAKTESQEAGGKEEWEDVEKPEGSLANSKDLTEEGEKVDQPDLAESEGEEVEKPKEELRKSEGGFELVEDGDKSGH